MESAFTPASSVPLVERVKRAMHSYRVRPWFGVGLGESLSSPPLGWLVVPDHPPLKSDISVSELGLRLPAVDPRSHEPVAEFAAEREDAARDHCAHLNALAVLSALRNPATAPLIAATISLDAALKAGGIMNAIPRPCPADSVIHRVSDTARAEYAQRTSILATQSMAKARALKRPRITARQRAHNSRVLANRSLWSFIAATIFNAVIDDAAGGP